MITLPQLRARWWRRVQAARRWRNAHAGPIIAALVAVIAVLMCMVLELVRLLAIVN